MEVSLDDRKVVEVPINPFERPSIFKNSRYIYYVYGNVDSKQRARSVFGVKLIRY